MLFSEVSTRDSVIGSSHMLAELVDKANNNMPKAGIRIVVPNHLKSTEKQLSDYGRRLRLKHGRGTKTHIKFDDGDKSIYLNIKLRGDNFWSRIYPEYARDWLKKLKWNDAEKLNKRLNSAVTENSSSFEPSEQRPSRTPRTKATSWTGHGEAGGDKVGNK